MMWVHRANKLSLRFSVLALAIGVSSVSGWQASVAPEDERAVSQFESMIKAGQYLEARTGLAVYVANHAQSWRALYQLGYVDFRLHYIQESLACLSKSLAIHYEFAEAHKILALDLNILGRKDLAVSELKKAIVLEPKCFECHYELGRIYYDQGSYLNAVEELSTAQRRNPAVVKIYHNLALAYSAVSENAKAIHNFEEGLKLNRKQAHPSAWPLIDYASYFNSQSEFENARNMLLEAIEMDASWDQAFDELSKAYRGLGQTELAIESLRRAVALNPRKPEYHYALARLYLQMHQAAEAKQELAEYQKDRAIN